MNWTSAGEAGGSLPFMVGGRTRVGFPGAPGCTTTGVAGAGCWAQTRQEGKLARVLAAASTHEHAATPRTTRISQVHLRQRGLTCRMYLIIVGLTLSSNSVAKRSPKSRTAPSRLSNRWTVKQILSLCHYTLSTSEIQPTAHVICQSVTLGSNIFSSPILSMILLQMHSHEF